MCSGSSTVQVVATLVQGSTRKHKDFSRVGDGKLCKGDVRGWGLIRDQYDRNFRRSQASSVETTVASSFVLEHVARPRS